MLFTASSGRGVPLPALTALLFLRAIALCVAELLALFRRGRFDLRPHDVAHGRDEIRDDVPLLAIPLLDEHGAVALVILARHLHGMREPLHPDLLESLVGQIQIFQAPAHLFAGGGTLAVLAL